MKSCVTGRFDHILQKVRKLILTREKIIEKGKKTMNLDRLSNKQKGLVRVMRDAGGFAKKKYFF